MDIRQLHYFPGPVRRDELYPRRPAAVFVAPALRQCITALEAELCGPLFVSAHHKLSLTDRGVSLQRHAAPVVEQFQQMQAALHAEIQSAQPVRIGISVSLVPDYLPASRPSWTSSASSTPISRCASACWTTTPWPRAWSRASWTRAL